MSKDILQSIYNVSQNRCPTCGHGPAACEKYVPSDGSCMFYTDGVGEKGPGEYTLSLRGDSCWWFIEGRKSPFATTTKKDANLILDFYSMHKDLRYILSYLQKKPHLKKIVKEYVDNGVYRLKKR